jgi:hypothetical protein
MNKTFSTKVASLVIAGLSLSGLAYSQSTAAHLTGGAPGTPRFLTVPKGFIEFGADAPTSTLPSWTGTDNGSTYTMLGASPSSGTSTTLPVVFVPLIFKIGTLTFDPTGPVDGSTENEIQLLEQSPIFTAVDIKAGSVDLGTNQYEDNFMRANFWSQDASGTNGYHLKLGKPTVKSALTITVPSNQGTTIDTAAGPVGDVNLTYFQNKLNSYLANTKLGLTGNELVIFVYYNTFFYEGFSSNCCVLGFHGQSSNNIIYTAAAFNEPNEFSGAILEDVTVITHEIGEAINDPFVSTNVNIVPAYGNIGQISGCQDNLEVGDPVTGLATTITMPNGFTYHPEDLVFHGWFTHETTSSSVNGWYTFLNNFSGDAINCPPGGTN